MTDVIVLAVVAGVLVLVGGVAFFRGTANTRLLSLSLVVGGVAVLGILCIAVLPMR